MKICSSCRESLPFSSFQQNRNRADGLQGECRVCKTRRDKEYREKHSDQGKEYAKAYRAAHPPSDEEKARRSKKFKEWSAANAEARHQYHREYRQANRERVAEREKARYSIDPHVSARRLIQSRVYRGVMPPASVLPCHDCQSPATDYDHYMGYEGEARAMVQPVCRPCHIARESQRALEKTA